MLKYMLLTVLFGTTNFALAGPSDPIISRAWVGESIPEQTTATLQLNLTTIKQVNLISVSSPLAESVEIHNLMKHKGEMKVKVVSSLPLPDHRTTTFGSRGLFLMMTGLKKPLKIGDSVPITMTFTFPDRQTKTISANAEVRAMELSYKHYGPKEVYDHR